MSWRPRCVGCGGQIGFNPRAQPYWEKSGREGTVPGAGWFHEDFERQSKEHPEFHYAVPPADATPESYLTAKQAHDEQVKAHVKRTLSRQFDFMAAEERGGRHIDLAED